MHDTVKYIITGIIYSTLDRGYVACNAPLDLLLCSSSLFTLHNSNRNIRDKFTLLLLSTRLACTRINIIVSKTMTMRLLVTL